MRHIYENATVVLRGAGNHENYKKKTISITKQDRNSQH